MRYKKIVLIFLASFVCSAAFALDPEKSAGMPESHDAGWAQMHQSTAKIESSSCRSCHKPWFCIDCHERRDSIQQRVHKRNYMFYHSVEARANPRKCDQCHKIVFCRDCHSNPR
ncbi:MAG: hypothetical protein COV46_04475 [Deltaproteobacteria bacterium CG11_big_fil_rev_8_21_14_0_20_49_13]|nr:MAG: hypothetical protein COV46_04475 [Deltaproteobacteria bacterium CG11_big_fil_rev_8_21_14_0_20_49_13]